jgi:hypothetical protein
VTSLPPTRPPRTAGDQPSMVPAAAGRAADAAARGECLKASLTFAPRLLGVALDLVTTALGAQTPVTGSTASSLLGAALTASALCAIS